MHIQKFYWRIEQQEWKTYQTSVIDLFSDDYCDIFLYFVHIWLS